MPYEPPPELATLSLAEIAQAVAARRLPPLAQWTPAETGESHMEIRGDGRWYHEGGEITRPAMVRAFSTLLMRDAEAQVRAIDTLAAQRVPDPSDMDELMTLFPRAKSLNVQRAIAGVLLRADYRAAARPGLVRALQQHRIKSPDGASDVIDVLIRRLQTS